MVHGCRPGHEELAEKSFFFLKKAYFQCVLRIEKIRYGRVGLCPGKRAFASPKKAGIPPSSMRASAVCSPTTAFPPRLFAERKMEGTGKVTPGPFCLRCLLFCPGNEESGLIDQHIWRSIFILLPLAPRDLRLAFLECLWKSSGGKKI
jgi:hypothetical protein